MGILVFLLLSAQVIDRVAVVVGKDVITETEVVQEARLEAFLNQSALDLGAEARKTAAERLVNQQLVRNEMTVGAYPEPTDAEVEGALKSFRQEHFNSIPAYRASLEKYGITEDQLKRHLKWQLAAIRFTDQRFNTGEPSGANRAAPGAAEDPFDAWLKQARSQTKIQFKQGAFQQ
jgi:hypothetical protein